MTRFLPLCSQLFALMFHFHVPIRRNVLLPLHLFSRTTRTILRLLPLILHAPLLRLLPPMLSAALPAILSLLSATILFLHIYFSIRCNLQRLLLSRPLFCCGFLQAHFDLTGFPLALLPSVLSSFLRSFWLILQLHFLPEHICRLILIRTVTRFLPAILSIARCDSQAVFPIHALSREAFCIRTILFRFPLLRLLLLSLSFHALLSG